MCVTEREVLYTWKLEKVCVDRSCLGWVVESQRVGMEEEEEKIIGGPAP